MNIDAQLDLMRRKSRLRSKKRQLPMIRRMTCTDCDGLSDMYMVTLDVWEAAGLDKRDLVCLSCLARHLGRELQIEDFTDAPCNIPIFMGFKLGQQHAQRVTVRQEPQAPDAEPPGTQERKEMHWDVI